MGTETASDIASNDACGEQNDTHRCADCGAETTGKFCSACGQETHVHRSLGHLGHELLHGVVHFDGNIWRTLPLLWANPGKLTRECVQGRRTRYVQPLALFLCTLFVMFMAISFTGGSPVEVKSVSDQDMSALKSELKLDMGGAEKHPVIQTIQKKLKNPDLAVYKLQQTIYKFAFLLLPLSIPFMWLLFFWRRDVTLYDHSVFILYSLTFMAMLMMAVAVLGRLPVVGSWLVLMAVIAVPAHMFAQLRGAYGLTVWSALWRTLFLLVFCSIVMVLFIMAIVYLGLGH